jgi:hypothetical protein
MKIVIDFYLNLSYTKAVQAKHTKRTEGTYSLKRVLPNYTVPKDIEGEWINAKDAPKFGMFVAYFFEGIHGLVHDGAARDGKPYVWFPKGGASRRLVGLTSNHDMSFTDFLSKVCRMADEVYHYSTIMGETIPQKGEIPGKYKRSHISPGLGSPRTGRHHNFETGEELFLA